MNSMCGPKKLNLATKETTGFSGQGRVTDDRLSVNYSSWAKSGPVIDFINNVLLGHSLLIYLCIVFMGFRTTKADWSICYEDCTAH